MNTPRNAFKNIESVSGGKYKHFGLVSGMLHSLKTYFKIPPAEIKINVNIDGLPLSKSSGSQFWPILISIETNLLMHIEPFVVGMYHGMSKPDDAMNICALLLKKLARSYKMG